MRGRQAPAKPIVTPAPIAEAAPLTMEILREGLARIKEESRKPHIWPMPDTLEYMPLPEPTPVMRGALTRYQDRRRTR